MYILWLCQIVYNPFLASKWNQSASWFWMNNYNCIAACLKNLLTQIIMSIELFFFFLINFRKICLYKFVKQRDVCISENSSGSSFFSLWHRQYFVSISSCWNEALGFSGPHLPHLLLPDPEDPWQHCNRSGRNFFFIYIHESSQFLLVSSLWY